MSSAIFTLPEHTPAPSDSVVQPMAIDVAAQALAEPVNAPESKSETISRLAALNPVDYDRVRKEEAKAMGIQVKTLDDMVKSERSQDSANSRLPFPHV